jgi:hypothetical protein
VTFDAETESAYSPAIPVAGVAVNVSVRLSVRPAWPSTVAEPEFAER